MSKSFLFSVILHVLAVGTVLLSSPFDQRKKIDFGEVIKVSLKSMSEIQKAAPEPPPLVIPQPKLADDAVEIPLDDPRTVKKKKEVKKSEEKPKLKEETKTETTATASTTPQEKKIDTIAGAGGQMFAGATVTNDAFDYPYWFDQAFNKIYANFRSPVTSDEPIVATIYFEVIQSGRVLTVKVIESSGIPRFDDACILAIERSAPFPPLPQSFRDEIIGITLPIKFDEK